MNKETACEILGVSVNSSSEKIKKAYRRLSLMHHPDRNNNSIESNNLFQKINAAYEYINNIKSSERKKANTDKNISEKETTDIFNEFMKIFKKANFQNINVDDSIDNSNSKKDIDFDKFNLDIHKIFGVNMHHNSMKPIPIIKHIDITLKQAYEGCMIPLEIERWCINSNIKQKEKEKIYINIPPGVDNNEIIINREKGNILNDKNIGDVKIFIVVKNETNYVRKGLDLHYNKVITLKESLCGFSFDLQHISGEIYKINNNRGNIVSNGYSKTIKNLGMKRDNKIGNLVITFSVIMPESLTEETITKLENIL
jgi:DnaJ-class molecular chaperone